ncbi:VUT family protein [Piscirickettsia salmonis]|uniref:VUT family protein n=1 Tax=Piscirickettsia salmonis TaxID=1238 RepID=UPI0016625C7D|nr:VUT family protein [Piscirickettsia salmonis]QNR82347.1 VUT family protein [Piscirickettsia salmonis]
MSESTKLYMPLSVLAVALLTATYCLAYKMTDFVGLKISTGIFIFPLIYSITDIVSQVYGARKAKEMVYTTILAALIFSTLVSWMSYFPGEQSAEYIAVLGSLWQFNLGIMIGLFFGSRVNIFIVSNSKLANNPRVKFWLRTLIATGIGEAVMTLASLSIEFLQHLNLSGILQQTIIIYSISLIYAVLMSFVITPITNFVKAVEIGTIKNFVRLRGL